MIMEKLYLLLTFFFATNLNLNCVQTDDQTGECRYNQVTFFFESLANLNIFCEKLTNLLQQNHLNKWTFEKIIPSKSERKGFLLIFNIGNLTMKEVMQDVNKISKVGDPFRPDYFGYSD